MAVRRLTISARSESSGGRGAMGAPHPSRSSCWALSVFRALSPSSQYILSRHLRSSGELSVRLPSCLRPPWARLRRWPCCLQLPRGAGGTGPDRRHTVSPWVADAPPSWRDWNPHPEPGGGWRQGLGVLALQCSEHSSGSPGPALLSSWTVATPPPPPPSQTGNSGKAKVPAHRGSAANLCPLGQFSSN